MEVSKKSSTAMTDVTQVLDDVASHLTFESPMLHTESFTLQDSMAALEVMDPKMDCCEVLPSAEEKFRAEVIDDDNNNNKDNPKRFIFPRPQPTGLKDEVDPLPWDGLTLEDAVFIAIENVVRVESFITDGSSIVESTFTSLYAHNNVMQDMKDRLEEPASLTEQMQAMIMMSAPPTTTIKGTLAQHIVFSSTLLMIQLTELIRGVILNADIFEEEDFTASTYNFKIYEERDDISVAKVGFDVLEMIEKASSSLPPLEDASNREKQRGLFQAGALILGLQLDFITVISSLASLSGSTSIPGELRRSQSLARVAVGKVIELSKLIDTLTPIQSDSTKIVLKRVFDLNVNRPLVGNAPLRKITFQQPKESLATLQVILTELDQIFCNILMKANTLGRIRYMLKNTFATSASILTRSLLVLNLYFDEKLFGQYVLVDLIVKHMKQLTGVPDDAFLGKSGAISFLNRLCKPVYDTLKVLALRNNRQRGYIDVMLGDWSALREEAYIVDLNYHQETGGVKELQPHFSLYVLSTTIELMDKHIDLGVELRLICSEIELGTAFWYRDFLTSSLLSQLNTMRKGKMLARQALMVDQHNPSVHNHKAHHKGAKKKGKNKKVINNHHNKAGTSVPDTIVTAEDIEDELDFLLWNVKRSLCRGLVRFFAALQQAGIVSKTEFEFTTNERIFEKRFELFSTISQPPPLTYDDYRSGSDFSKVPQNDLLASTADCFRMSKSMIDRILAQTNLVDNDFLPMRREELLQLAKVCVGNSVYVQKLTKVIGENEQANARVAIDTDTNPQFCTIKIE